MRKYTTVTYVWLMCSWAGTVPDFVVSVQLLGLTVSLHMCLQAHQLHLKKFPLASLLSEQTDAEFIFSS